MTPTPRPVVLVHGMRTSSAIWSAQTAVLAREGHLAVAVDLPGHGARTGERFTFQSALDTIDEAVASCPAPPLLVGLSMGGYVSLAYAARRPEALAGVLLSGCSTEIRDRPMAAYRRVSGRLARTFRPQGTWHVVTDMLGALHGYSPLADLRRLVLPLWLVNGLHDPMRLDERRYLTAHPAARLSVLRGAGHDVNTHAPAQFNRILLEAVHQLRDATRPLAPALT
ncbi:lysophospholipase [Actinomycetota bacterium]|nr:lysophospholipase [Actinomycetota bacterium]